MHFASLQESALLKRDDLQLEESKIWEYITKWGNFSKSYLPINFEELTKENFFDFENYSKIMIRYLHISGDDILKKVQKNHYFMNTQQKFPLGYLYEFQQKLKNDNIQNSILVKKTSLEKSEHFQLSFQSQ
ncbi:hypothetical protein Glove_680g58 [Diversispora epigaea]|uniref:Uncharacterized protein n=1 Tax=Diversispora epigaea TaxID=1348612 RepID=A0A397G720_9GLOM|nr:hypothetical protein Glove_680g58 [Diversispora epigaea]